MAPLIKRKPISMNSERRSAVDLRRLQAEIEYEELASKEELGDADHDKNLSTALRSAAIGSLASK